MLCNNGPWDAGPFHPFSGTAATLDTEARIWTLAALPQLCALGLYSLSKSRWCAGGKDDSSDEGGGEEDSYLCVHYRE